MMLAGVSSRNRQLWITTAAAVLVACCAPLPVFALDLFPIPTSGFDTDIVFELGLTAGQVGANGELGDRQFFEAGGTLADGLPRSISNFTSTISGNVINFEFEPFESNNILKFITGAGSGPKSLTFETPQKAGMVLAVVHTAGSMLITSGAAGEVGRVPYTINYAGGATQTGEFKTGDWGAITPANLALIGTENIATPDRTSANATMWPVNSDNNTTANRWGIRVSEIAVSQPTVNIESISFGPVIMDTATTTGVQLNAGDDIVIFGLAGNIPAPVLGDTNGNGIGGEYPADFNPIRDNFRKARTDKADGDLVNNNFVDFDDFRQWKAAALASGVSLEGLNLSLGGLVPEPSSALLALVALIGLGLRRGNGRSGVGR